MKKISTLKLWLILISLPMCSNQIFAQTYCSVTTAIPYVQQMPGISNFTLNTINRTSLNVENMPANSYVNTGLSTTLAQGQTYSISITHTQDQGNFPGARNNLRVWIDYNQNFTLDDAGETALSVDLNAPGTYTGQITIPVGATLGSTRMRVTAKMSIDAGHTLPTPCDIPADPIGYHGEIEDYSVTIVTPSGINNPAVPETAFLEVYPNPTQGNISLSYNINSESNVAIEIFNILGEKQFCLVNNEKQNAGLHKVDFDLAKIVNSNTGVYFVKLTCGNEIITKRIILTQ